ncbi:phosphatidylcholine transfer protein, putative [Babesia caballi]|uniref:Phosphatidylcholine transfer protein, putative n=1 Tax=Babesia caballi TaxID=5871 RepID=A0AAV4LX80_BABCB|nr:phosphatidylcholine transfer protein, putative [Babesia caballi]
METSTTTSQSTMEDPCASEPLSPELTDLLCRFLQNGDFSNWDYVRDYTADNNQLKLYSKFRGTSTLKEFMVYGSVDVCKEKLLELVMHMSRRTDWDDTYVEHSVIVPMKNGSDVVFSVSKYPFPLAKRTYVIKRTVYGAADDVIVLATKVIPYDHPVSYRWSMMVEDFESVLMVYNHKDNPNMCTMLATYYENPKVILPNMYLNMIIETLVPRILQKMVVACKKYGSDHSFEYCRSLEYVPLPATLADAEAGKRDAM